MKVRRPAVAAANRASAEERMGTSSPRSARAAAPPSTAGRTRRAFRFFAVGDRAAGVAPSRPNNPRSSKSSRSGTMDRSHQGRRASFDRPQAWIGASARSARKFQNRKYTEEVRAKDTASSRRATSSTRLSRASNSWRPKAAVSSSTQPDTARARPMPWGQDQSTVSTASRHQPNVPTSRSRSRQVIS